MSTRMCDVIWFSPKALPSLRCCKYCCTIHPHLSNESIECASKPQKAKERRNCKKKWSVKSEAAIELLVDSPILHLFTLK